MSFKQNYPTFLEELLIPKANDVQEIHPIKRRIQYPFVTIQKHNSCTKVAPFKLARIKEQFSLKKKPHSWLIYHSFKEISVQQQIKIISSQKSYKSNFQRTPSKFFPFFHTSYHSKQKSPYLILRIQNTSLASLSRLYLSRYRQIQSLNITISHTVLIIDVNPYINQNGFNCLFKQIKTFQNLERLVCNLQIKSTKKATQTIEILFQTIKGFKKLKVFNFESQDTQSLNQNYVANLKSIINENIPNLTEFGFKIINCKTLFSKKCQKQIGNIIQDSQNLIKVQLQLQFLGQRGYDQLISQIKNLKLQEFSLNLNDYSEINIQSILNFLQSQNKLVVLSLLLNFDVVENQTRELIETLTKFKDLRELGLKIKRTQDFNLCLKAFSELQNLKSLQFYDETYEYVVEENQLSIQLIQNLSALPNLTQLLLKIDTIIRDSNSWLLIFEQFKKLKRLQVFSLTLYENGICFQDQDIEEIMKSVVHMLELQTLKLSFQKSFSRFTSSSMNSFCKYLPQYQNIIQFQLEISGLPCQFSDDDFSNLCNACTECADLKVLNIKMNIREQSKKLKIFQSLKMECDIDFGN